jgi:uncharacterized membrane protein
VSKSRLEFTESLCKAVEDAITQAELLTSGEIALHVESTCAVDPYQRAIRVFESLNLHQTELRNAVLIYLTTEDRKLAIIGDAGIHRFIHPEGWQDLVKSLTEAFKQGQFEQGLTSAVLAIGQRLAQHFPRLANDRNEISNQISFLR